MTIIIFPSAMDNRSPDTATLFRLTVNLVVPRPELRTTISKLLRLFDGD